MSEEKNIQALKDGDISALDKLVDLHKDYVYTLALRIVKTRELADEVTQDVFVKVYQKIDAFRAGSKFSTWLYTIVYRTALNYLEQHGNRLARFESLEGYEQNHNYSDRGEGQHIAHADRSFYQASDGHTEERDLQNILWKAIDALPYLEGIMITLFYLQQFTLKEIAEVTQFPVNTVKTHVHRGRKRLKEQLLRQYALEDLI